MRGLAVALALAGAAEAREGAEFRCVLDEACLSDSPCGGDALELDLSFIGPYWIRIHDQAIFGMVETYADGTTIFFGWNNRLQPHHVALSADGSVVYSFGQMNDQFPESLFGGLYRGRCVEGKLR